MNQDNSQPNFERADAAISEGKLWRAKEILQGQIGSFPYNSALYEKYGVVLLKMGDLIESGKFLFISGARSTEYDEAIEIFLSRHGRTGWRSLIGSLPSQVRNLPLDQFPKPLQGDLQRLEYFEPTAAKSTIHKNIWLQRLFAFGVAIFVICSFIGLGTILYFAISFIRNVAN